MFIGRPHSAQEGSIIGVQVSDSNFVVAPIDAQLIEELDKRSVGRQVREAGVGSSSIAVPHIDKNILERFACGHVENTNI